MRRESFDYVFTHGNFCRMKPDQNERVPVAIALL
jgi:hypothetical protein